MAELIHPYCRKDKFKLIKKKENISLQYLIMGGKSNTKQRSVETC